MKEVFAILILLVSTAAYGQRFSIEDLEYLDEYTSLEEALLNPDSVYRLRLRGRLKLVPPEVFSSFPNLQELNLSKNRLKEIPPEIQMLKNLKKLSLFKNRIEALPPEIGELENLEELIINNNELETLPEEIGKLKKLRYIDLWSNNIVGLPESISDIPALQEVDLRVIVMTESEQEEIKLLLPNAKVHMDEHCNCGN